LICSPRCWRSLDNDDDDDDDGGAQELHDSNRLLCDGLYRGGRLFLRAIGVEELSPFDLMMRFRSETPIPR